MSDPTNPGRALAGLGALQRMKAPAAQTAATTIEVPATSEAPTPESAPAAETVSTAGAPTRPAQRRTAAPTTSRASGPKKTAQKAAERVVDSPKEQLGTRIARDVGQRARSTFRATGYLEGDASFSEFVEKAILLEVERREREHNNGRPFTAAPDRLPAGPPLRS